MTFPVYHGRCISHSTKEVAFPRICKSFPTSLPIVNDGHCLPYIDPFSLSIALLRSLRLLDILPPRHRLAEHPHGHKRQPRRDGSADTRDPGPRAADDVAPGPLIVGHVADRDGVLLADVGEERPLVVDQEVEDAVLVRQLELGGVGRRVFGRAGRVDGEREAVEGRQH